MELKSNEEKITRALLVSVDTGEYDAQASLDELFELVKSAGADPVLSVTQNLQKIEKGTFCRHRQACRDCRNLRIAGDRFACVRQRAFSDTD